MTARQQGRLLEHFVAGTTARAAAELVGVQRTTAIKFYHRLRQLIASKLPSYELSGEVEAEESYFGGHRKGKRGRGATGKVPVFGLLKRGGKVYTAISPIGETLMDIIKEKVTLDNLRGCPAPDQTRLHHRMVMLETGTSSCCQILSPQIKNATVALMLFCEKPVPGFLRDTLYVGRPPVTTSMPDEAILIRFGRV